MSHHYHIGTDHYGYALINPITQRFDRKGITYSLYGSGGSIDKVCITNYIPKVCKAVRGGENTFGILLCGTGVGVDMGANKFQGIRAVFGSTPEVAGRGKKYDNANVLCLSSWLMGGEVVLRCLEQFHTTQFEDPEGRRSKRMHEIDTWK